MGINDCWRWIFSYIYIYLKFFSQIPCFLKNKSPKKEVKQIIKNRHTCSQFQRQSLIFYFHIFEYCQIWLDILMDCQLINIMKLRKKMLMVIDPFGKCYTFIHWKHGFCLKTSLSRVDGMPRWDICFWAAQILFSSRSG